MNNIIKILNINDHTISVVDQWTDGDTKFVEIIKKRQTTYCPNCGSIMHSKGINPRIVNHSMLNDGFKLVLIVDSRKWKCTNPQCNRYMMDTFSFVEPNKRQTNLVPFFILNALKDYNKTCAEVARAFNVSDTYAREVFMSYVDIKRLPLPEVLNVDEVYLNIDYKTKYSCVLMDFVSNEIVDILPNRWQTTLDSYFYSISREERSRVKFVICDMYQTYINFRNNYFPNSTIIIDSFHVISNLNGKLNKYILDVKKKYAERDRKLLKEKNEKNNTNYQSQHKSKEVNLLNTYTKFLLGDVDAMKYRTEKSYNKILKYYASDYDIEKEFLKLDAMFPVYRELKQKYLNFNKKDYDNDEEVEKALDEIIEEYSNCGHDIFVEFAQLLNRYKQHIIASFRRYELESTGELVRLSNGPMEGFNRKPKDMKRDARGFEVFEYIRARLIYSSRKDVPIRSTPKNKNEIVRSEKKYRQNRKKK